MARRWRLVALLAPALLLAWGLTWLFSLRYAQGEDYPEYSSLRTDPVGAKALHEALGELDGVAVERNLRPLGGMVGAPGTTLLMLGFHDHGGERLELWRPEILRLAQAGYRVVVALAPLERKPWWWEDADEENADEEPDEPGDEDAEPLDEASERRRREIARRAAELEGDSGDPVWTLDWKALPEDDDEQPRALTVTRADGVGGMLPEELPWGSILFWDGLPDPWTTVYTRGDAAVVAERAVGRGSIVLATDAYLASNEALLLDRRTAYLSWLLGSNRSVVFDETHLGVAERPGIAALGRRYGLTGLAAGLAALALLFVWRAGSSLVPRVRLPAEAPTPGGRTAAAGLADLLRRAVPRDQLLHVCVDEWGRAHGHGRPELVAALHEEAARAPDPVTGYRRLTRLLARTTEGRTIRS